MNCVNDCLVKIPPPLTINIYVKWLRNAPYDSSVYLSTSGGETGYLFDLCEKCKQELGL